MRVQKKDDLQAKIPNIFPEETISFPGPDDMCSHRRRYAFPERTGFVPREDGKVSQGERYIFLGQTI
jgi:hypothetical protein